MSFDCRVAVHVTEPNNLCGRTSRLDYMPNRAESAVRAIRANGAQPRWSRSVAVTTGQSGLVGPGEGIRPQLSCWPVGPARSWHACGTATPARFGRGANVVDRGEQSVPPEIVGLPPTDLAEQVGRGAAVQRRGGQHRVLELAAVPSSSDVLGQELLPDTVQRRGSGALAPDQASASVARRRRPRRGTCCREDAAARRAGPPARRPAGDQPLRLGCLAQPPLAMFIPPCNTVKMTENVSLRGTVQALSESDHDDPTILADC